MAVCQTLYSYVEKFQILQQCWLTLGNPVFAKTEWTKSKSSSFQAAETHKEPCTLAEMHPRTVQNWRSSENKSSTSRCPRVLISFSSGGIVSQEAWGEGCPLHRFAEDCNSHQGLFKTGIAPFLIVKGKGRWPLFPCCGAQSYYRRRAQLLILFKGEMECSFVAEANQNRSWPGPLGESLA